MPAADAASGDRARDRVGTVINGKWAIDRLLGVGGMAVVYEATHRNRKRAALKMLHPELSVRADVRSRFLREGYVANTVNHPGAVRVDDDDVTEDGAAYLVMELLEGETIDARASRAGGTLPLAEVLRIAIDVLDVLVAAHAAGVVHRDLKPDNLFLNRDGVLKVLDFGIARLREGAEAATATRTGSFMGTPAFMAPEQARGRWAEVDARTDLWSVGAIMFTLLTGRFVHAADTVNETMALACTQRAPALAAVRPDVSTDIAQIVDRALAYERADRFPDAASMQAAARAAAEAWLGAEARLPLRSRPEAPMPSGTVVAASGAQATAAAVAGPTLTTRESRGGRVAIALGAAAIVVALGAGLWLLPGRRQVTHPPAVSAEPAHREAASPPAVSAVSGPEVPASVASVPAIAPVPASARPKATAAPPPRVGPKPKSTSDPFSKRR